MVIKVSCPLLARPFSKVLLISIEHGVFQRQSSNSRVSLFYIRNAIRRR